MALADQEAVPQHMAALRRANRVRLARSALKAQIAAGERSAASVIADPPAEAESMAVWDALFAQHRWGPSRVRGVLRALGVSENRTLGALTDRQRGALVAMLKTGKQPRESRGY